MIRFFILLLILLLLKPSDLRAEEGMESLLRNSQEAISHRYTRAEVRGARRRMGGRSEEAFRVFVGVLELTLQAGRRCGAEVVMEWEAGLSRRGIPFHADALVDLLILWRSQNKIDDILLSILEVDIGLFSGNEVPKIKIPWVRSRDTARVDDWMRTSGVEVRDLEALLLPFRGKSPAGPGCTLLNYRERIQSRRDLPLLLKAAEIRGLLDPEGIRLLLFYDEYDPGGLTLETYLETLGRIKNREATTISPPSRFLSEISRDGSGLTRRERLYSTYDPTQIRMLTGVLKKLFSRMDSTRADLVFTRPDGSGETIPLTPMGQYYFARKLLKRDLDDLSGSYFFRGLKPSYEDLLAAALETGLIGSEMLDPLLKVDDLWNPELPPWKRLSNTLFKITGSASVFLPPPYNFISSIALVFASSWIDRKSRQPSQGDPGYDPF
jgi:hypothetical protein